MSKTMADLHKIRETIFEEEKSLSKEAKIKKTRETSDKFLKKYGLKPRRLEKEPAFK